MSKYTYYNFRTTMSCNYSVRFSKALEPDEAIEALKNSQYLEEIYEIEPDNLLSVDEIMEYDE